MKNIVKLSAVALTVLSLAACDPAKKPATGEGDVGQPDGDRGRLIGQHGQRPDLELELQALAGEPALTRQVVGQDSWRALRI